MMSKLTAIIIQTMRKKIAIVISLTMKMVSTIQKMRRTKEKRKRKRLSGRAGTAASPIEEEEILACPSAAPF